MRAFEEARPVQGGLPMMHEIQRNNVRIVVEPIADGLLYRSAACIRWSDRHNCTMLNTSA